jgi:orotidine-5'-phosphate decarboxylase
MNQIIIAMDMEIEKGLELIKGTAHSPEVYGYKIGSFWLLDRGVPALRHAMMEMVETDKKIILDMQKWGTDIPEIVAKQINRVMYGTHEIIVCPMGGGRQSLRAFAEACFKNSVAPVCVLEMTHPESGSYLVPDAHLQILNDALSFGIKRFVIPATKEPKKEILEMVKLFLGGSSGVTFYATGFKAQGGQTKPMRDFGVTKFIVGRAIYEAEDPIAAVVEIGREINE